MGGKHRVKPLGLDQEGAGNIEGMTGPASGAYTPGTDPDLSDSLARAVRLGANRWQRWNAGPRAEKFGAYGVKLSVQFGLMQIAALANESGIHPDVLGPCRRASSALDWILMFRPIKTTAMQHVGEFAKLPKPMEIKVKADRETGLVRYRQTTAAQRLQQLKIDIDTGLIDRPYAQRQGLTLDGDGYLVNKKGQKYFSDMDLYEVLHASRGWPVRLGSGASPSQGLANRRQLDTHINILRGLGCDFALIQHGPDRQWEKHVPRNERITAFTPDGEVYVLAGDDPVNAFIAAVRGTGYQRSAILSLAASVPGIRVGSEMT